jgi:protein phosphatase 2C family protein 2/3
MGHGTSVADGLNDEEKAYIAIKMKDALAHYTSLGNMSESQIYEALAIEHAHLISSCLQSKGQYESPSGKSPSKNINEQFLHRSTSEDPSKQLKLLKEDTFNAELLNNPPKIRPFGEMTQKAMSISHIPVHNLEQVASPVTSFRKRRLTVTDTKSEGTVNAMDLPKRASIFSSGEIGVRAETAVPLPAELLGTFSCHGIEPEYSSDDEAIGVHQKINQDRGCVVYPFNKSKNQGLFMVLDGHGIEGNLVSEYCMRQIVPLLEKTKMVDPIEAFKYAFTTVNKDIKNTDIKYLTSGTTCVALYIRDNTYWVSNVGDSRAVLARVVNDSLQAIDLSIDHKPSVTTEKDRIISSGGFVGDPDEEGLSSRVYLNSELTRVGLAVSRSLGDHIVKDIGVTADPDVMYYEFHPTDKFIVLASDGVWEFLSSQDAVELVNQYITLGAETACEKLIETASNRWKDEEGDYRDDITAIIVTFPLPFQMESEPSTPQDIGNESYVKSISSSPLRKWSPATRSPI